MSDLYFDISFRKSMSSSTVSVGTVYDHDNLLFYVQIRSSSSSSSSTSSSSLSYSSSSSSSSLSSSSSSLSSSSSSSSLSYSSSSSSISSSSSSSSFSNASSSSTSISSSCTPQYINITDPVYWIPQSGTSWDSLNTRWENGIIGEPAVNLVVSAGTYAYTERPTKIKFTIQIKPGSSLELQDFFIFDQDYNTILSTGTLSVSSYNPQTFEYDFGFKTTLKQLVWQSSGINGLWINDIEIWEDCLSYSSSSSSESVAAGPA